MNTPEIGSLVEYLATGRTHFEINRRLRKKVSKDQIVNAQLPAGYAMFEQKNDRDESVFTVVKQKEAPPGRVWNLWMSEKREPYQWVQFPSTYTKDSISIVPLSDVHYGAKAHSLKRFKSYLKLIEERDDVFTFLNGDLIENAIDGSVGGASYESIMTPSEQLFGSSDGEHEGIIELLRPIAHKILWAQPGNHEWRTWKAVNLDPMQIICRELKIPYHSEPVFADVLAWGQRFTFYCHHGTTGAGTKGGKFTSAGKPGEFQEAVDFIVMGHVHDSMMQSTTRIVRKRKYGLNGQLVSFELENRIQHVVVCPSFHGFFDSYGARAGYAPGSWGSVKCTIYKSGSYQTSD